jgi:hypothetical protein
MIALRCNFKSNDGKVYDIVFNSWTVTWQPEFGLIIDGHGLYGDRIIIKSLTLQTFLSLITPPPSLSHGVIDLRNYQEGFPYDNIR